MARALAQAGVREVFCVPGESYLPLLAALPDAGVRIITCRHEGTAAMAAEAMGRLRGGMPGVCLVTRAPGAANAMAGVVVAQQDATPLLVIAGQVARGQRHAGVFQDADLTEMFRPLCKHVEEVCEPAALPAAVRRACHMAQAGVPGPVFLSLPEDVLTAAAGDDCMPCDRFMMAEEAGTDASLKPSAAPHPAPCEVRRVAELLAASERPLLIAGGGPHLWTVQARERLHELGMRLHVPLISAFRRQGLVDATHEACAGTLGFGTSPALLQALREADMLLLLGARPRGVTLQVLGAQLDLLRPPMPVAHVCMDAAECGRAVHADVSVCATPQAFLEALPVEDMLQRSGPRLARRQQWMAELHAAQLAWSDPSSMTMPGTLDMAQVWGWLRQHLPADAIICSGAGNYALWLHRFFHHRDLFGQLAPVSGSMGYGLPAALAAKLRFADRTVVAVAGDGCFQMSMQDFATAAQYGLGIIVLVVDNGQLGTIRGHQLRRFPAADCATTLQNPRFDRFAEACGGFGAQVSRTEEFADAFREAERHARQGRPALLHLPVSPQAIAPGLNAPA